MKAFCIGIIFSLSLWAGPLYEKMSSLYQSEQFEHACNVGIGAYRNVLSNENFLSLAALSCLKAGNLQASMIMGSYLKSTPEYRTQSLYFQTLFLAKQLLYAFMVDGQLPTLIVLPQTDHMVTKLVERIGKKEFTRKGEYVEVVSDKKMYRLSISKEKKLIIEEKEGSISRYLTL